MVRERWVVLLAAWLALVAGAAPSQAAPPGQSEPEHFLFLPAVHGGEDVGDDGFAAQGVDLVTGHRAAAGCRPLVVDGRLVAAAEGHSEDMAHNDFFSHTGSDGSLPWDRMEAEGYEWSRAAENIAAGFRTPEDVVAGWMNSSGHRANILDCRLVDTGVGYVYLAEDGGEVNYHHYWTQVFGTPW